MGNYISVFTVILPIALILGFIDPATAQTKKSALTKSAVGEDQNKPYITYNEFQQIKVNSNKYAKNSGELGIKSIMSVKSLDSLNQYLGPPEEVSKDSPFGGSSVLAYVNYEGGLDLEYVKVEGSDYKLRELEITTPEWHFRVNDTRLQPGLGAHSLDESVRREGSMLIAAPGGARKAKAGGMLEVMEGSAAIQIDIDEKTQNIEKVRFTRML